MSLPQLQFVSWQEFHLMGFELSQQLKPLKDIDQIVSVARGGHVLARILSDLMDLPIFSVSIQSYQAMQQHEIEITQELAPELVQRHVLLVDEVVDSGKTLERGLEYLSDLGAEVVTSVAAHVKPHASHKPDFYIEVTDNWVVYPYEVRETIESLKPIWLENGYDQDHLRQLLASNGMSKALIGDLI